MKLRDYQEDAVRAIFDYFARGNTGDPLVLMPTGTGKSVVIGEFVRRAYTTYPGTRIMKLTHSRELIKQNHDKLLTLWPTAPSGVYSAGLKRKDIGFPIIFGGVASVAKATPGVFGRVDLLLVDEAHLVSPNEDTMYRAVINGLREVNPLLKVVGFTATDYRMGHGRLTDKGGLFTDVAIDMTRLESFNWFIDQGYLCNLIPKPTGVELDVSGVRIHGGEYKPNELQAAVDKEEITYRAIQEMMAYGVDRDHWLVFAAGVEHAKHVAAMLDSLGVPTTCVHSKMSSGEQDANLAGYRAGRYRAMVNNGILTTGFDFPGIDLIGMLRPTQSASLWVQMLGRGARPVYAPGYDLETLEGRLGAISAGPKQNCLVLDFARNTPRLGPINDPILPKRRGQGGGGVAPVRICESCGTYNHASARFCIACGVEFPRMVKLVGEAGTEALVKGSAPAELKVEEFDVDRVVYREHRREGRPPTVQATYHCGLRVFKEWICLEHEGYAGKKARDRMRLLLPGQPVPESTWGALQLTSQYEIPKRVRVWLRPRYDEVMEVLF